MSFKSAMTHYEGEFVSTNNTSFCPSLNQRRIKRRTANVCPSSSRRIIRPQYENGHCTLLESIPNNALLLLRVSSRAPSTLHILPSSTLDKNYTPFLLVEKNEWRVFRLSVFRQTACLLYSFIFIVLGPVHTTPDKLENEIFTLKTYETFFMHTMLDKFEN